MPTSRFEEAEEALDEAADLFAAAENAPLLSGVMLERASLLVTRGNPEAALDTARRALSLVSGGEWPVQHVYAHLRLADLLLPNTVEVEPHLLAARDLAERLALPQLRYHLTERLGHLRRLQGREEEAQRLLEAAVEEIERQRGTVTHDADALRPSCATRPPLTRNSCNSTWPGTTRRVCGAHSLSPRGPNPAPWPTCSTAS